MSPQLAEARCAALANENSQLREALRRLGPSKAADDGEAVAVVPAVETSPGVAQAQPRLEVHEAHVEVHALAHQGAGEAGQGFLPGVGQGRAIAQGGQGRGVNAPRRQPAWSARPCSNDRCSHRTRSEARSGTANEAMIPRSATVTISSTRLKPALACFMSDRAHRPQD